MIRKTMTVLAGAVFGVSLLATPAGAAEPGDVSVAAYRDCPADRLCIWTGLGGSGAIGIFRVGDADLGDAVGPRGLNNNAESMMNRTGKNWCLYDGAGYTAYMATGGPGQGANMYPRFRNRLTSLKVC